MADCGYDERHADVVGRIGGDRQSPDPGECSRRPGHTVEGGTCLHSHHGLANPRVDHRNIQRCR